MLASWVPRTKKAIFRLGVLSALTVAPAICVPVTWTLSNTTFNDGGTVSGYFIYDADARAISDWNIVTTAGSILPAFTYTPATSVIGGGQGDCPSALCIVFVSKEKFNNGLAPPYNFDEDRDISFRFTSPLSDAGGTINLNLSTSSECLDCNPYRLFKQGSVSAQATTSGALTVAPGSLSFQIGQGAAAQSQTLQIGGTAGLAWQASVTVANGGQWLSLSPGTGQVPSSVTVAANPAGLASGTYQSSIVIQASGATPPSVLVPVTLAVNAPTSSGGNHTIENLTFTGSDYCLQTPCSSYGKGPITGFYSLDLNTQTIVGPWKFATPLGSVSSTDPGATATVYVGSDAVGSTFSVDTATFLQFVKFFFTSSNVLQIGHILTVPGSDACINIPGGQNGQPACGGYNITGSTSLVSVSGPPWVAPGGIVPLYSPVNTIQPGEFVSIYGENLASSTASWNGDFPTSLGGTSVTINGKSAFLTFVSPTQINLQAPDDTARGAVPVVVTSASGSGSGTVTLAAQAPSLLLFDSSHVAGIIPRSDGSGAYGGGTYDMLGPAGNSLGYPTVPAKTGDTVALFAVGLGPTSPPVAAGQPFAGAAPTANPVTVLINNTSLTPSFAGLAGAGLYQVNVTIPPGLGTGDVSLVARVGGAQTQSGVVISVQAPIVAGLKSLTLSSNSVGGGGNVTGTVVLSAAAPSGGAVVALSSSSSAASVPASVTVPAGAASATFTISTGTVSSNQSVTITASYSGQTAQAAFTITPVSNSNGNCQTVSGGPYQFRVWNTLSTDVLVQFGDVILPSGQHGSLPFGAQMHSNECDIIGLPQIANYAVAVSRYPNGAVVNNNLTFSDTSSGFIFNGRSAYTLRITQGSCSASADQGITFQGQPVYSVCVP